MNIPYILLFLNIVIWVGGFAGGLAIGFLWGRSRCADQLDEWRARRAAKLQRREDRRWLRYFFRRIRRDPLKTTHVLRHLPGAGLPSSRVRLAMKAQGYWIGTSTSSGQRYIHLDRDDEIVRDFWCRPDFSVRFLSVTPPEDPS